jgi:hypothetical protein
MMNKEMNMNIFCMSVEDGWQSCYGLTGETFGPTFRRIQDLWAWQKTLVG